MVAWVILPTPTEFFAVSVVTIGDGLGWVKGGCTLDPPAEVRLKHVEELELFEPRGLG